MTAAFMCAVELARTGARMLMARDTSGLVRTGLRADDDANEAEGRGLPVTTGSAWKDGVMMGTAGAATANVTAGATAKVAAGIAQDDIAGALAIRAIRQSMVTFSVATKQE